MKVNQEFDENIELTLNSFQKAFLDCNSHTNLVSKNDAELLWEKHICDSLSLNIFFDKYKIDTKKTSLLDIGTGGGFPSIPIAITNPKLNVTAIDSIRKKINCIETFKNELCIKNFHPLCTRVEDYATTNKGYFDLVTTRAVSELRVICEYCAPFIKQNGYFVAFKSKLAEDEIKNAQNAMKILGLKLIDKIDYELPIENDHNRVLLVFKKIKQTPYLYPRKNGLAKKSPL